MTRWTLSGRKALITGGTKGIGEGITQELTALGARATIIARDEDLLKAKVAAWRDQGFDVSGVAADVTTADGRALAVAVAAETMGGIDILINNVGTNVRKMSLEYDPAEFETVFETNVTAAWEMCRSAHVHLAASDNASIVNIGSVAGAMFVGSGAPYAMTKAALDQLTRYLAVEWAHDKIRVNSVNPWYTKTPLAAPVLDDPQRLSRVLLRTPLGRVAEAADVAGITAFLCLPAAGYLTGQCIAVDGGFLSYGFSPADL